MDHQISAQQKCTIPTLAPPALLVNYQLSDMALVSVTEWSVGDIPVQSKYISYSRKVRHNLNTNLYPSYRSCVKFEGNGTFTPLPVRLEEARYRHLCWSLPSGEVLLMGGWRSKTTTERVHTDGSSSSADFTLPYDTR